MKIKTSTLIIIIVLIILVVLAIIFGGYKKPGTPPGPGEVSIAKEIYGISGTVEEIKPNTLIVNALILLEGPAEPPINKRVNVIVDIGTKLATLQFPDPETLTPEQIKDGVKPKETEIKFSDLKIGDKIDIQANENISENIKNNIPFVAKVINVVE